MSPSDIMDGIGDVLGTPYNVDWDLANQIGKVVGDVFSIILGFAAVFITLFMTVMTTLDLVYLTIPAVRSKVQEKNWDGSTDKSFRLISTDARVAYEEYAVSSGTMPVIRYLKKRVKTYFMCTIILVIIVGFSGDLVMGVRGIVIKVLSTLLK